MVATIPTHRILEGLLFHRLKQRAVFLVMKLAGLKDFFNPNRFTRSLTKPLQLWQNTLTRSTNSSASEGPWICGAQFTLADVGMMVILDRLRGAIGRAHF